ncbi:MAG: 3-methyl-2-oxobutanoate hydroxymethyltransferase [Gammaproteobacteria bacterium]|nr:3-methyl-2-oxobutanoate hydroxymethyltransferase [Gammaproteobacteria bacterium]MCK5091410.1 3-methyl-2-oxobutanoate hydroxymethyltransferase [Gammaproteobacteria bacterium]
MYKNPESGTVSRTTVNTLMKKKQAGEKIVCLTAYDASFSYLLDHSGVDVILVGDSLGMVIQGHETTLPVTMDDMVYHTRIVASQCQRALLIADMPFMSYSNINQALSNAARLMKESGAHMIKLEGGETQLEVVRHLARSGIPVCAHLGLQPQSVHKLGGYRVQGRDKKDAKSMLLSARALQDVGADMLLLECVPSSLATDITHSVEVPVIGIGAGSECDGQILVLQDVLGITPGTPPRFSKNFMLGNDSIQKGIESYVQAVRDGSFPSEEQSFS